MIRAAKSTFLSLFFTIKKEIVLNLLYPRKEIKHFLFSIIYCIRIDSDERR
jgi:hypothetical protein